MIIETSCNRFYVVWETKQDGLDHVWFGQPVKKIDGEWIVTSKVRTRRQLVRKAASRIVEA